MLRNYLVCHTCPFVPSILSYRDYRNSILFGKPMYVLIYCTVYSVLYSVYCTLLYTLPAVHSVQGHFKSKEELFGATISSRVENEFLLTDEELDPNKPIYGLTVIAKQFISLIRKDEVLSAYRTMFASTFTHPEICNTFYQNGPMKVHREVSEYLKKCSGTKSLNINDFDLAATQFLSLFQGLNHTKCLLGLGKPSKKEDDDLILKNVEFFIKASC